MNSNGDKFNTTSSVSYVPYRTLNTFGDSGNVCSHMKFDNDEELLWIGSREGRIWSYCAPSLSRYTAFSPYFDGELRDFSVVNPGILALTSGGLSLHKRGGRLLYTPSIPSNNGFERCFAAPVASALPNGTIFLGGKCGIGRKLNLERPDYIENLHIGDVNTFLLKGCDRYLCFASHYGDAAILDVRSNQIRNTRIVPDNMVICDMDAYDYSLLVCAHEMDEMGNFIPNYSLFVHDLRVCKATSPIATSIIPSLVKFLPNSYGQYCAVADMEGKFQIVSSYASGDSYEEVHKLGEFASSAVCMDFSSTGNCLAVGDCVGLVHLWSSAKSQPPLQFNTMSRPLGIPENIYHQTSSSSFVDAYSNWSSTRENIHPLLRNQKNSQSWPTNSAKTTLMQKNEILPSAAASDFYMMECSPAPSSPPLPARPSKVEEVVVRNRSRKPQISWKEFNTSSLPALEPDLPSSYCNGILQALYNILPLSAAYQSHICCKEFCLSCELGFLFHMMTVAGSEEPCQASNLHRVLRSMEDAVEKGLVVNDAEELFTGTTSQTLIQNWLQFVLEYTHKEFLRSNCFNGPESAVSQIMAWKVMDTICYSCGHILQESHKVFAMPLRYGALQNHRGQDLHHILRTTLNENSEWLMHCNQCKYENIASFSRSIASLPESFALNFRLEEESNFMAMTQMLANWTIQQLMQEKKEKPVPIVIRDGKICRYGSQCNRTDCSFIHPRELETPPSVPCEPSTFIPSSLWMNIGSDGKTDVVSSRPLARNKWTEYEVTAACYVVRSKEKSDSPRFVSAVKVKNSASGSPWHFFNDLVITSTTQSEALHFDLKTKIPCIVFYSRVDLNQRWPTTVVNPINRDIFLRYCEQSMPSGLHEPSSVIPLQEHETFGPESLVALDAEFVSLSDGEVEMHPDGTKSLVKPSQMSLGRVTVIRGTGVLAGTPFMDEYVVARDKIVDHLTEFSGIQPGDLCADYSSKRLQTLKSVYIRLRYLVDSGVRFVGHGLNNDFRVINIKVPKRQIIDTVQLFRLPDQRLISLRFLAWFFLGSHIQMHSHDSIEDAQSALYLHQKYEILIKETSSSDGDDAGNSHGLIALLTQMYEIGRSLQWKIPLPQS